MMMMMITSLTQYHRNTFFFFFKKRGNISPLYNDPPEQSIIVTKNGENPKMTEACKKWRSKRHVKDHSGISFFVARKTFYYRPKTTLCSIACLTTFWKSSTLRYNQVPFSFRVVSVSLSSKVNFVFPFRKKPSKIIIIMAFIIEN